jgi:S1-C subfamily serine protease
VSDHQPGDSVRVELLRDGRRVEIEVKLGIRPARASTP